MLKIFSSPQAGAHVVATIVVLGFVLFVAALALHFIPQESQLLTAMGGGLLAAFQNVVGYYMGSSMGSAQKTAQISHLIGQPGELPAASQPGA